jgi:esterase/lipase superfamily enzyme
MSVSNKILVLFLFCMSMTTSILGETKQPKILFFRIELEQNVAHFGHFKAEKRHFKAIETKTLAAYNEADMTQLIQNELDATIKNHRVLVYIHGMWGSRNFILKHDISTLEEDYGTTHDVVIHIIWESRSPNVWVCQKNARNSNPFVTPILRGVLNLENTTSTLMCHSMGNYLFFELIDALQNLPQPFEKIFLMAPDVSLPVFDKKLDVLESVGKYTKVYYNKKDLILFFSQIVNNDKRLGKKGTDVDRDFIEITDCTHEKNKGFLGRVTRHSYFRTSAVVREELRKEINF